MNILREVRRVRNKSWPVRILLLLAFCVISVVTTYAWFSTQRNVTLGGLYGETIPWDVSYYIKPDEQRYETQMLDETAVFTIEEFYPGMPSREDLVHVYNLGAVSSEITYELISVKVFGQEILTKDLSGNQYLNVYKKDENGENILDETVPVTVETDNLNGTTTTTVFSEDTSYPFKITYTYDRTKLIGVYDKDDPTTEKAHATLSYKMTWKYEDGTLEKDMLDTQFGKQAYEYYQNGNDKNKAVEVKVRITSKMIDPSTDPDYVKPEKQ